VFVFFFLAEYGSIVLMCILTSLLFLGGYLPIYFIYNLLCFINFSLYYVTLFISWLIYSPDFFFILEPNFFYLGYVSYSDELLFWLDHLNYKEYIIPNYPNLEGLLYGLNIGLKSSIMIFVFIWARASFPRIRFDQLMGFCWTVLLPILFALIIFVPCVLFSFDIFPPAINLF
jgi:NADH-ubiquinone oxidoreductase chain 1